MGDMIDNRDSAVRPGSALRSGRDGKPPATDSDAGRVHTGR